MIGRYKFDLKIYMLVMSCETLRMFAFNEELTHFAVSAFSDPLHNSFISKQAY